MTADAKVFEILPIPSVWHWLSVTLLGISAKPAVELQVPSGVLMVMLTPTVPAAVNLSKIR